MGTQIQTTHDYIKIKQLVDKATNDMFFQPDWTLNLSIVDTLNSDSSKSEMFVFALKTRLLETKDEMVMSLCIDLYETLIKNCETVIPLFGRRDFQEMLVKTSMETQHFRVQDKIFDIVQFLADGLNDRTDLFYGQSYKVLLYHHKVKFPPKRDETFVLPKKEKVSSPSFKSQNPYDTQNLEKSSKTNQSIFNDPFGLGHSYSLESSYESLPLDSQPKQISNQDRAILKQIEAAKTNCTLLLDLLDNIPQGRSLKNNEVVNDVMGECKTIQKSFLKIIEECSVIHNEKLLDSVLKVNDMISETIKEYNKALNGERIVKKSVTKTKKVKKVKKKKEKKVDFDEFSMLASRKRPDQDNMKNNPQNNSVDNMFLSSNTNNSIFNTQSQNTSQLNFFNTTQAPPLSQNNQNLFGSPQQPSIDLFSMQPTQQFSSNQNLQPQYHNNTFIEPSMLPQNTSSHSLFSEPSSTSLNSNFSSPSSPLSHTNSFESNSQILNPFAQDLISPISSESQNKQNIIALNQFQMNDPNQRQSNEPNFNWNQNGQTNRGNNPFGEI